MRDVLIDLLHAESQFAMQLCFLTKYLICFRRFDLR